ncbi:hypothetical protein [Stenotrophomonas sp. ATs4]|uniref:hypothetical protein n=1 Tax=Stenotrophomonas sp. ATs4 TaxID=3402766 RepID=UPI003F6E96EA
MQISPDYPNFHLRHRIDFAEPGVVVYEIAGQPAFTRMIERRFQASTPIVAAIAEDDGKPIVPVLVNEGGGNWLVRIYAGSQPTRVAGTLWIYDLGVYQRANYGFELFRDDGSLSFSTAGKPMRIIQVFPPANGSSTTQQWVDVPAGRRYAAVTCRAWVQTQVPVGYRISGPNRNGWGPQRFYTAGSTALIPAGESQTFNQLGMTAVIDVTGH